MADDQGNGKTLAHQPKGRYMRVVFNVVETALLEAIERVGGATPTRELRNEINSLCEQRVWPLTITSIGVDEQFSDDFPDEERAALYQELVSLTIRRVESVTGQHVIRRALEEARSCLSPVLAFVGETFDPTRELLQGQGTR